jgi:hypothetical protein
MRRRLSLAVLTLLAALPAAAQPLGTAFTYQGQLLDAGSPANGSYDFQLVLYDATVGGSQVGPIVLRDDVAVGGGLFAVALDFGPVFAGARRFLEIGVRPGASSGAYTVVGPRQELTPSPNAVFSSFTDPLNLTSLNASNLTSGTVPGPRLSGTYAQTLSLTNAGNAVTGAFTGSFTGDGSGLTNLNAQPRYVRTVVVSPVGTPAQNGDALRSALDSITTASATNPWLLKVEPGIYDVGASTLAAKPFVDVEGSGETVTILTKHSGTTPTVLASSNSELRRLTIENDGATDAMALVADATAPHISHVKLLASGGGNPTGFLATNGAAAVVSEMTVIVTGSTGAQGTALYDSGSFSSYFAVRASSSGGNSNRGIRFCCLGGPRLRNVLSVAADGSVLDEGVDITNASPSIENLVAVATGVAQTNTGILVTGASSAPSLHLVSGSADGASLLNLGVRFAASQPTASDLSGSAFGGSTARGIDLDSAGPGASLSQVRGGGAGATTDSTGIRFFSCSPRAVGVEAFANADAGSVRGILVDTASPSLSHLTVAAGGATSDVSGIYNLGATSAPSFDGGVVTASGAGAFVFGIANLNSSATITHLNATASGPSGASALYLSAATVRVTDANLTGLGAGSIGVSIANTSASALSIDRSSVAGGAASLQNSTGTTNVAVSQLIGPVPVSAGTNKCLLSYNGAYLPLNASCQ